MTIRILFRIFVFFCLYGCTMAGENVPLAPSPIFARAIEAIDIWSAGPFHLHANVTVNTGAKELSGQYDLYWVDKNQWRDDIIMDKAHALRIGIGREVWSNPVSGSTAKVFLEIRQLMNLQGYLKQRSQLSVLERTFTKINGVSAECLKLKPKTGLGFLQSCFSAETSLPLGGLAALYYVDFMDFQTKKFPRSLAYTAENDWKIKLTVEKLVSASFPNPTMFTPPDQKHLKAGCLNQIPATPISEHPRLNESEAKESLKQFRLITFWIVSTIDTHGVSRDQEVIGRLPPFPYAPQIFEHLRYEPATCDGVPVESQVVATVELGVPK